LAQKKTPTPTENPDGSPITKTIHTFTLTALQALQDAKELAPKHFIKVSRSIATTLKTGFTKLLQDYDRYKACTKCVGKIQDVAKNDLRSLVATLQFVLNGLGPVDSGVKDVHSAYKEFYAARKSDIDKIIKLFD
jgi:hypothetical protein